ncbi:MAG: iron-containing alcohol dehydrogenase, partial [Clostridia bacterium]|nr:iron-containing alcohol dehydrogenase [Clostridia bacterium]
MSSVMELYRRLDGTDCACGKKHVTSVKEVIIGDGVIAQLPEVLARYGVKKPFLLADPNTWKAAGEKVFAALEGAGIASSRYVFESGELEPDEHTVGSAVMHMDYSCDGVIAIGSGVINDTGKILSSMTKTPYIVVGTAPSMDGYASKTSSMSRDGLKVSINTRCADVIIGDLDVLCDAPEKLLISGLGDMLAKYVSICEWRIARLLVGEPYCEAIASLVRASLDVCVKNAGALMNRDKEAVKAVFEGLVVCGAAM